MQSVDRDADDADFRLLDAAVHHRQYNSACGRSAAVGAPAGARAGTTVDDPICASVVVHVGAHVGLNTDIAASGTAPTAATVAT